VVLAEDEEIRRRLSAQGVAAQRLEPNGPVAVCATDFLAEVLAAQGQCPALGLTGRPPRRLGSLITAQAFRLSGRPAVFIPTFMGEDGFYFGFDMRVVIERLLTEIAYVNRSWTWAEAPLLVLPVTRAMAWSAGFDDLARTLADLSLGRVPDLHVQASTLGAAIADAHTVSLDDAPRPRPLTLADWEEVVLETAALDRPDLSAEEQIDLLYRSAGRQGDWEQVRRLAHRLDRHDERLQDAVKEMVVRQKRLVLGPARAADAIVTTPVDNGEVIRRLRTATAVQGPEAAAGHGAGCEAMGDPCRAMLAEEMVLFCGTVIKASPDLFRACHSMRPLDMLDLLVRNLQRERPVTAGEAHALLAAMSPHAVATRLRRLVTGCPGMTGEFCLPVLARMDDGPVFGLEADEAGWSARMLAEGSDWEAWRDVSGTLLPLPPDFFARVWDVLHHCDALIIADPAEPTHRLDSVRLRADATPDERDFAHEVEARLDRIADPLYRQLTVETLWAVSEVLRARPHLRIAGALEVDDLLAAAVHSRGGDDPAAAWHHFRALPPTEVAGLVAATFLHLAGRPGMTAAA
ncbi:MAG: hypothetical protein RLY86_4101, partial [Pseudomonadota bacterium]